MVCLSFQAVAHTLTFHTGEIEAMFWTYERGKDKTMRYLGLAAVIFLASCSHEPEGTGDMATIKSCGSKPNCVSSTAPEGSHFIEPLAAGGDSIAALERVRAVMKALPRTNLVGEEAGYLHYEVTSRIMRYVDDVESDASLSGRYSKYNV